jgi:hypothetical protein
MQMQSASKIVLTSLLLLVTSTPNVMAADECSTDQSQLVISQNASSVSGHGTLVVNNEGADIVIRAENLTPGVAYTAWFVYFNNTAQCLVPNACAAPDLITPLSNPVGVFGRMDSGVAGANGQLTFKGTLRDFRVSAGSAVHVALFAHGPANSTDNRLRAQQLLTPQAPALGAPGLGVGTQAGFLVAAMKFDIAFCK